jgi:hypothetical protein
MINKKNNDKIWLRRPESNKGELVPVTMPIFASDDRMGDQYKKKLRIVLRM